MTSVFSLNSKKGMHDLLILSAFLRIFLNADFFISQLYTYKSFQWFQKHVTFLRYTQHESIMYFLKCQHICLRSLSNLGNVAPVAAISGSTVSKNIVHGFSLSLSSIIYTERYGRRKKKSLENIIYNWISAFSSDTFWHSMSGRSVVAIMTGVLRSLLREMTTEIKTPKKFQWSTNDRFYLELTYFFCHLNNTPTAVFIMARKLLLRSNRTVKPISFLWYFDTTFYNLSNTFH